MARDMHRRAMSDATTHPAAAQAWPAGSLLGSFELTEVLACRSAGILYRGWDHALALPVAVKEYMPLRLATRAAGGMVQPAEPAAADLYAQGLDAFITEARTLAHCDHPALVRVLHLLRAHGTAYRVMPWYGGRSLLDLRREMASPPDEAALRKLLDQLLGALEAYHRVGGVHGGVRPSQIMLLDGDQALLLGPRAVQRATASDAVETLMRQLEPVFEAPEQRAPSPAGPPGPWTDLHALAGVLRFAITGQLPPPPDSAPQEPLAVAAARLAAAGQAPPYSAGLLAALDAAAAPAADARPRSLAAFRALLDAAPAAAPGDAEAETLRFIRGAIAMPTADAAPAMPMPMPMPALAASAAPPSPPSLSPPRQALAAPGLPRWARRPWALAAAAALPLLLLLAFGVAALRRPVLKPVPLPPTLATAAQPVPALPPEPAATLPAPAQPAEPAKPAKPPAMAPTRRLTTPAMPKPATPASPRAVCAARADGALQRCLQQQCARKQWARHAQCQRLKRAAAAAG